jgi:hypothetical protein
VRAARRDDAGAGLGDCADRDRGGQCRLH